MFDKKLKTLLLLIIGFAVYTFYLYTLNTRYSSATFKNPLVLDRQTGLIYIQKPINKSKIAKTISMGIVNLTFTNEQRQALAELNNRRSELSAEQNTSLDWIMEKVAAQKAKFGERDKMFQTREELDRFLDGEN